MSDDDIQKLLDENRLVAVQEVFEAELFAFARAIEQRTLINAKAKWYQEGRESAIEECLSVVRKESQNHFDWDKKTESVAFGIVAFKLTKHFGAKDD